jgi:hypothetical protein
MATRKEDKGQEGAAERGNAANSFSLLDDAATKETAERLSSLERVQQRVSLAREELT